MGAGTTCRQHTPTSFLSSNIESTNLEAYRDVKQKTSASYSLSTVEGIQQVSDDGVVPSMSEKLRNEEVNEVTQYSDVDVLPGSTRSWTRTGRGGVQEYTSMIHVSSKS